jgi:hypothetical protein
MLDAARIYFAGGDQGGNHGEEHREEYHAREQEGDCVDQ